MGKVSETILVRADLKEVWDLYFDQGRWGSWVDGFGTVISSKGYPEAGGTLQWQSNPAGRGEVTERVIEHEPRRRHRVSFSDPQSEGELLTRFEIHGEAVEVTQQMSYEMLEPGLFGPLTDRLFVRGQVARSLRRSLERLKLELESSEGEA